MTISLVTGGAGFIGSHIVQALLESGDHVRVLDNFSTGRRENLAGLPGSLEIIEADLRDADAVARTLQGAQRVFHLAAMVSVPQSMEDPILCSATNELGTLTLLENARKAGVERVVISSSCAVYGDSQAFPLEENTELSPLSPYAVSKRTTETYAALYKKAFDLDVVALRYFNIYGPRQRPDSDYAAVIPIFIQKMLAGSPITIHGDGSQKRDFVYVKDVVRANLLAAASPKAGGGVFNVCTGVEFSVLDLAEMLSELIPNAPAFITGPSRAGDIYRSVGNPNLAAEILGFRAEKPFLEGLAETVAATRL